MILFEYESSTAVAPPEECVQCTSSPGIGIWGIKARSNSYHLRLYECDEKSKNGKTRN